MGQYLGGFGASDLEQPQAGGGEQVAAEAQEAAATTLKTLMAHEPCRAFLPQHEEPLCCADVECSLVTRYRQHQTVEAVVGVEVLERRAHFHAGQTIVQGQPEATMAVLPTRSTHRVVDQPGGLVDHPEDLAAPVEERDATAESRHCEGAVGQTADAGDLVSSPEGRRLHRPGTVGFAVEEKETLVGGGDEN